MARQGRLGESDEYADYHRRRADDDDDEHSTDDRARCVSAEPSANATGKQRHRTKDKGRAPSQNCNHDECNPP